MRRRALQICIDAHRFQKDKGGEPYFFHPIYVMFHMDTKEEQIVAILHDVVEDSKWTLDDLKKEGFPEKIINAVDAMTKRKDESIHDYYIRVKSNSIARKVKIQDLNHNMDISRLPTPKTEQEALKNIIRSELYEKYKQFLLCEDENQLIFLSI